MVKSESHTPKIRFQGFADAWDTKKLSQISSRVQEKNRNNQITETFTNSAERGIINQRDFFDKDISNEANLDNYYIVQPDDFVYNPRISNFAPVGPIKRNKLGRSGVMSPLYSVFRPDANFINFDYLEHYFSTTNWHKFMFTHGDQGARSDRFAIGMATFQKMPISLPKLQEQTKIGNFFQKIDQVIELQQKALDTARDYKKSMLQKMFPQKGENVPQIRFDGFSEDWENKNLKQIAKINPSSNLPDEFYYVDLESVKGSRLIEYSEEFKNTAPSRAQRLAKKGDVFYQTVRPYQKNNYLFNFNEDNYVFSTGYAQLRPIKSNDSAFIFAQIQNGNFVNNVLERCTGTSYPAINSTDLSLISIYIPIFEEQKKIGEFFQKLDQQIEQHEKKLESYQNLKKAMLQRMFV